MLCAIPRATSSACTDAGFLAGFDVCVASVHSHFDLPRAQMTRRLIAACEDPRVNIIGDPLAQLTAFLAK